MRSYLGLTLYLFGVLAILIALEAAFTAWWDLSDESLLPLFAAAVVVLVPLMLFRAARGRTPRFEAGGGWAGEHVIASSVVLAIALFLFLFAWGVVVREPWGENLTWSAGAAAAVLAAMIVFDYTKRAIRRREARKRGIATEDYKPGKLARRLGWILAAITAAYLALGLAIELSDALG